MTINNVYLHSFLLNTTSDSIFYINNLINYQVFERKNYKNILLEFYQKRNFYEFIEPEFNETERVIVYIKYTKKISEK